MLNGAQAGPVTSDELNVLFTAGTLKGDTLVWRQGMAAWLPANQVPELAITAATATTAIPAATVVTTTTTTVPLTEAADIEKNKIFAVISYLPPLLFIVPIVAARESKFAMYHCNQGAILTIVAFATWIATFVLGMVLNFIPILGFILSMLIHLGVFICIFGLAILGIMNAANGKLKPLPVIGTLFTLIK